MPKDAVETTALPQRTNYFTRYITFFLLTTENTEDTEKEYFVILDLCEFLKNILVGSAGRLACIGFVHKMLKDAVETTALPQRTNYFTDILHFFINHRGHREHRERIFCNFRFV
jgi:hypothetical protein